LHIARQKREGPESRPLHLAHGQGNVLFSRFYFVELSTGRELLLAHFGGGGFNGSPIAAKCSGNRMATRTPAHPKRNNQGQQGPTTRLLTLEIEQPKMCKQVCLAQVLRIGLLVEVLRGVSRVLSPAS